VHEFIHYPIYIDTGIVFYRHQAVGKSVFAQVIRQSQLLAGIRRRKVNGALPFIGGNDIDDGQVVFEQDVFIKSA